MKAKFGAIVVDGRGKLGGHVFSKNRGGAYVRTKVTPVNPQSSAQQNVRGLFTNLSQQWRELTQDQRNAWNAAVANFQKTDIFGDIKNPSGFNLYMRLNQNIMLVGGNAIEVPPSLTAAPDLIVWSAAPDSTPQTLSLAFAPSPVPTGFAYVIEATPCVSAGKSFVKNLYRVISVLPEDDTTPNDALAAYTDKFGALVQGQKVSIRMRAVDVATGIVGAWAENSYIVL